MGWRSTTLGLAERHCSRALDFYEAGAPYDRDIYAVGTAAHAVLEEIGKASAAADRYLSTEEGEEVARLVCEELIASGRDFEGEQEPPLPSSAVWRGRDLAMAYHRDYPMWPRARYEEGLAVNREWMPCPYDEGAWLRARIDAVGTVLPDWTEDDAGGPILEVRDYKSSWAAGDNELSTLQRKIQAVLAWGAWGPGHEALRLIVVNFRVRREYETTVLPGTPEGAALLARWRRDIETEIHAREAQVGPDGRRPASPGPRCFGCPYLGQDAEAQAFLGIVYRTAEPAELARFYGAALAQVDMLAKPLRAATEDEPIAVDDHLVGSIAVEEGVLRKDAPIRLAETWLRKAHPADLESATAQLPGLLTALKLGVAQARALLFHLYQGSPEEREKRERYLASLLAIRVVRRFGVHRKEAA